MVRGKKDHQTGRETRFAKCGPEQRFVYKNYPTYIWRGVKLDNHSSNMVYLGMKIKVCGKTTQLHINYKTIIKFKYKRQSKMNRIKKKLNFENVSKTRGSKNKQREEILNEAEKEELSKEIDNTIEKMNDDSEDSNDKNIEETTESSAKPDLENENESGKEEENGNENGNENENELGDRNNTQSTSVVLSNIKTEDEIDLKNQRDLFIFTTTKVSPDLVNAFFTSKENLILVFKNQADKTGFMKRTDLKRIFGKDMTMEDSRKEFYFLVRNIPKSYDEDFVKTVMKLRFNIDCVVKIFKSQSRFTAKISTNAPRQIEPVIKEGKIKLGYTFHKVHLPMSRAIEICRRCGKYGHKKPKCVSKNILCTFCSEDHEREQCEATTPCCIYCREQHPATSVLCGYRKRKRMQMKERTIERYNKDWNLKLEYSPLRTGLTQKFRGVLKRAVSKASNEISQKVRSSKKRGLRNIDKSSYNFYSIKITHNYQLVPLITFELTDLRGLFKPKIESTTFIYTFFNKRIIIELSNLKVFKLTIIIYNNNKVRCILETL